MQPYDDEDTSYATLRYSLTKCTRTRTRTIAQAKEKMMNEKLQRETLAGVKDVGTAVRALASCMCWPCTRSRRVCFGRARARVVCVMAQHLH
jgi:hypothetical protein